VKGEEGGKLGRWEAWRDKGERLKVKGKRIKGMG